MCRSGLAIGLMVAMALGAGCKEQSTGGRTAQKKSATPSSSKVKVSKELKAYMASAMELIRVMDELQALLESIKDAPSAAAAKPKVAALVPQFENATKDATSGLLGVTQGSAAAKQELLRLSIARTAADKEWADQVMKDHGFDPEKQEPVDIVAMLTAAAKAPGSAAVHPELAALRDIILRGRAPIAIPKVRERLQQKLGPAGSPLRVPR